jgi:TPR repeat protein
MRISDVIFRFIRFSLLIALIHLLAFTGTVSAREALLSTAQKYYYGVGAPKNYHKALRLYLKAAQDGNVDAMFIAGGMYMQGQGTSVNTAEAFKWLYKAAINGRSSKESERILGQSFITGKNVPQNYEEALHWYEKAATGGDAAAQSELGFIYFSGKMMEADYEKAHHWFETAARNDYPIAQYNMGILWYTGNGVGTIDTVKAYAWFNLADANGHRNGGVAKQFLETILSTEELKKAQELSIELYRDIKQFKK